HAAQKRRQGKANRAPDRGVDITRTLRQTLRGQADVRSTRFSDDRVIIFQKADKPWPHACMGQWCLGINVPVAVDKWFLFLLAGSLGAGDEGIEKLQRINADEELSADVDVLVT